MPNYGQRTACFALDMLQAESKLTIMCRKAKLLTMEKTKQKNSHTKKTRVKSSDVGWTWTCKKKRGCYAQAVT